MRNNAVLALGTAMLGLFAACSKDSAPTPVETVPDPIASFTYSGARVTPAVIVFQNTSTNADSYLWDFGDGTVSTDSCPTRTYDSASTYNITLRAICRSTGRFDTAAQQITITPGRVFLEAISVVQIPFINSAGLPWDIGSGPDLYVIFRDYTNPLINFGGGPVDNVQSADLPLLWQIPGGYEITDWAKVYYVEIWDDDPLGDDDHIGTPSGFTVNNIITHSGYVPGELIQDLYGNIQVMLHLRWE